MGSTPTVSIAVLALSLALVVPTAAVGTATSDDAGVVVLVPTSEYATTDGGELALRFDRLNAAATTSVDDAFEITAADESVEAVRIAHDLDGVSFYADGDRNAALDSDDPVALGPGETVTVGVAIDARDAPTGTQTFAIVVETADEEGVVLPGAPPGGGTTPTTPTAFAVAETAVEPTSIGVGGRIVASATVTNPHEETVAGAVEFAVGGAVVADRYVELEPGENRTVTFEWRFDRAGAYEVSVGGASAGTVTVAEPARFRVGSHELPSPLTAAVAPPAGIGLLLLLRRANDHRT